MTFNSSNQHKEVDNVIPFFLIKFTNCEVLTSQNHWRHQQCETPWKILLPLLAQLLKGWLDSFIMRTRLVKVLQGFRDTNPPPRPTYQISKILRCIYFFILKLEQSLRCPILLIKKKKKVISSSQGAWHLCTEKKQSFPSWELLIFCYNFYNVFLSWRLQFASKWTLYNDFFKSNHKIALEALVSNSHFLSPEFIKYKKENVSLISRNHSSSIKHYF